MATTPTDLDAPAVDLLAALVAAKAGGSSRQGQVDMCAAVDDALRTGRHLLVEAPTGTGKSLAYAVPAALAALRLRRDAPAGADDGEEDHGARVVISTATKALQEQLVEVDLPFVATHLAEAGAPFTFALLKGRSNYLCRARVAEVDEPAAALFGAGAADDDLAEVFAWAEETETGDRSELEACSDETWAKVSLGPGECPGAASCDLGDTCFAEAARSRAAEADVVVVNTHLYAAHLAAERRVLPGHGAVVFDEAHELEATFVSALTRTVGAGRLHAVASRCRAAGAPAPLVEDLRTAAKQLDAGCRELVGRRVDVAEGDLASGLRSVALVAARLLAGLAVADPSRNRPRDKAVRAQAAMAVRSLAADLDDVFEHAGELGCASWVDGTSEWPRFCFARIDVAPVLASHLYPHVTVVATSATLAIGGRFDLPARRLGLFLRGPGDLETGAAGTVPEHTGLAVETPFDHARQGILYTARHLPDPSKAREAFEPAAREELAVLAQAAGGRTLALFTSWAAARAAAAHLRDHTDLAVQCQGEGSRTALVERFRATPRSVLCATTSFWTGLDLHGEQCTLVVIDRIPFGRPDDPVLQARIELAEARGANGFVEVQLPAAAVTLAQGVGRLIRSVEDRGVVAVLDRRLATAGYRDLLLRTIPPLWSTTDQAKVVGALGRLDAAALALGR
ncbi:ATP-dependent DNA helicase [Aquihabitans sp. G128]|uniref:ATP-dependent DNA helicase n=1 Tax=Aquihabitans sp. G128 TaxID=2849779 RepID=UPI001C236C4E|nr:ATP-dependent DNA helicase [Aquihabitans sp. G128]QXC62994.1 ATP-dependent DNA helicase [Aquihabitans sp. G128]